ncbi:hypothetical protein [Mycoplasmopsis glycophila]|uniref:Uncharacterized protein n=1 Tax=Mycoplasmopsis glycophila TaxID=171285 RepID=A0A449AV63_9BACT|nr:hypothetical protein [Mycoplasmopsis glycophila]VEU70362.1 Uncharacterised protein [Mycoplasmopsis glycophila]
MPKYILSLLIFIVILLFILLFFFIFKFVQNLIIKKNKNKINNLFLKIQRSLNTSEATVKKAESLQRTKKIEYGALYEELTKILKNMNQIAYKFKEDKEELLDLLKNRKLSKFFKEKDKINNVEAAFSKYEEKLIEKSKSFNIPWLIIDDDFSNMLDISQNLLNLLENKKYNLTILHPLWKTKIQSFRESLNAIEKSKLSADFEKAHEDIAKAKELIAKLLVEINKIEKIEYVWFYKLPATLQRYVQDNILSQSDKEYYGLLLSDIKNSHKNIQDFDINSTILKIKSSYEVLYDKQSEINKRALIQKFQRNNKALIQKIILDIKDKLNRLKEPNDKMIDSLNLIQNQFKDDTLDNTETYKQKVEQFIFHAKRIEKEYFYVLNKNTLKDFAIKEEAKEIFNSLNIYYKLATSIYWDNSKDSAELLAHLKSFYNSYFSKKIEKEVIEKIWLDWIKLLSTSLGVIAQNEMFLLMFKKLESYLVSNSKYRNKTKEVHEILTSSYEFLNQKNFKEAYFSLKKYISKNKRNELWNTTKF